MAKGRGKAKLRKRKTRKPPRPAAAVLDQLQPISDSLTNLRIRPRKEEETVGGRGPMYMAGDGIPAPSKGELPWASNADIANFLDRPHMLAAEGFAKQLGVGLETVSEWHAADKLIGVEGAKSDFRFPAWQIDAAGRPYPAIERILVELDGDHWAAWRFLEERVPEVGAIGFEALAAGKEEALLKALLGRSYGSFS